MLGHQVLKDSPGEKWFFNDETETYSKLNILVKVPFNSNVWSGDNSSDVITDKLCLSLNAYPIYYFFLMVKLRCINIWMLYSHWGVLRGKMEPYPIQGGKDKLYKMWHFKYQYLIKNIAILEVHVNFTRLHRICSSFTSQKLTFLWIILFKMVLGEDKGYHR